MQLNEVQKFHIKLQEASKRESTYTFWGTQWNMERGHESAKDDIFVDSPVIFRLLPHQQLPKALDTFREQFGHIPESPIANSQRADRFKDISA